MAESSLTDAAVMLHELFLSYVAAGFSEEQAMQLICAHIAALPKGDS